MKKLRYKILLFILPVIIVPLAVASYFSEQHSSQKLIAQAEVNLQTVAQGVFETLKLRFAQARQDLKVIAGSPEIQTYLAHLEFGLAQEAKTSLANIQSFFERFQDISGLYAQVRLIGPQGQILARSGPPDKGGELDVFFDRFSGIPFGQESTKMSPVRRLNGLKTPLVSFGTLIHGTFKSAQGEGYDQWGVLILDLDWNQVVDFLNSLKAGRAILWGQETRILSHPDPAKILSSSLRNLGLVRRTLNAPLGTVLSDWLEEDDGRYYTVSIPFEPDPYRRWGLFLQVPAGRLLAQAREMRNLILGVSAICVLAAIIGILIVAGLITRPIQELVTATEKVAKGDLSARTGISSRDEIGRLAQAFNQMTVDLTVYINQLQIATAEKERLESELAIAAQIQSSVLPKVPPDVSGLEVASLNLPARETGGDFYDYLVSDDDLLGLTIADVSGKGLPAALYMLSTRSVIRTFATEGLNPAAVLERSNALIEQDSGDSGMFVTTFYATIDLNTHELIFANAGHNPPLLFRTDGQVEPLSRTGLALGLSDLNPVSQERVHLEPGDVLVLYTDGVTEAINAAEEEFGLERLRETIRANLDRPALEMTDRIREAVFAFAGAQPQFDDFTLTVVRSLAAE